MLQKKERPNAGIKLLDVVELRSDVSEAGDPPFGGTVAAGALGAIVDELPDNHYLVEFGGDGKEEPSILTLPAHLLIPRWSSPE